MESSGDEQVVINDNPRKKKRQKKEWAKNVAKQRRNSAKRPPTVTCAHPPHSYCKARALSDGDIADMFDDLYTDSDKVRQDAFITSHILLAPVKRHRFRREDQSKRREFTSTFFMTKEDGEKVEVCQKSFRSLLSIGETRLRNLMRYTWRNNNTRPERRGGVRVKPGYDDLKQQICNHIRKFRCRSSHYGINKTPSLKFLPSTLSINKMYLMFKDEYTGPLEVQYGLYHQVFVSNFNLGFGSPRKDVCSFCTEHKVQIRATTDQQKKRELITELLVHKHRARKFYQLMDTKQDNWC
ncbi:uncharacterized protein [Amphiura filiformis]|uniref:uncharacterized protein isoform X2 n=1 Tax=Amphiura filiformis TaxID=82378 RepID=UPI003B213ADE